MEPAAGMLVTPFLMDTSAVLLWRSILRESWMDPAADMPATPALMDANASLLGCNSEKISRDTRYLAARYAKIRDDERTGDAKLDYAGTDEGPAGIFTKPLCGWKSRYMCAEVLGHYNTDGSMNF